jgi:hypothetical protein
MAVCQAAEEVSQQRDEDGESVGKEEVLGVVRIEIDGRCGLDGGVDSGAAT